MESRHLSDHGLAGCETPRRPDDRSHAGTLATMRRRIRHLTIAPRRMFKICGRHACSFLKKDIRSIDVAFTRLSTPTSSKWTLRRRAANSTGRSSTSASTTYIATPPSSPSPTGSSSCDRTRRYPDSLTGWWNIEKYRGEHEPRTGRTPN
jgi:hypothetical protein